MDRDARSAASTAYSRNSMASPLRRWRSTTSSPSFHANPFSSVFRSPAPPPSYPNGQREDLRFKAQETLNVLPRILARLGTTDSAYLASKFTADSLVRLDPSLCPAYPEPATIHVVNDDTLNVAIALATKDSADARTQLDGTRSAACKRPLVVNFANRHSPGGGWLNGALAQEEALCYRSSLALSLDRRLYPLDGGEVVYSPYVLVLREAQSMGHNLLPQAAVLPDGLPVVSVVSVAALREPDLRRLSCRVAAREGAEHDSQKPPQEPINQPDSDPENEMDVTADTGAESAKSDQHREKSKEEGGEGEHNDKNDDRTAEEDDGRNANRSRSRHQGKCQGGRTNMSVSSPVRSGEQPDNLRERSGDHERDAGHDPDRDPGHSGEHPGRSSKNSTTTPSCSGSSSLSSPASPSAPVGVSTPAPAPAPAPAPTTPALPPSPAYKLVFAHDRDRDRTKAKMRLALRAAAAHGHDQLVLGALGCGVYRNPPEDVAHCWLEVLREAEFAAAGHWWRDVVFAVYDGRRSGKSDNGGAPGNGSGNGNGNGGTVRNVSLSLGGNESNYEIFHRVLDGQKV